MAMEQSRHRHIAAVRLVNRGAGSGRRQHSQQSQHHHVELSVGEGVDSSGFLRLPSSKQGLGMRMGHHTALRLKKKQESNKQDERKIEER